MKINYAETPNDIMHVELNWNCGLLSVPVVLKVCHTSIRLLLKSSQCPTGHPGKYMSIYKYIHLLVLLTNGS